jgi:hypothetical protein
VRVPKAGRLKTLSGYFDDREKLFDALESASGECEAGYYTVNPTDPALLARSSNELVPYAKGSTNDKEVPRRLNMIIDGDPKRPTGISATNEQVLESKRIIVAVRRELSAAGWPQPLIALSGNGHHAIYAIDLPNDSASRDLCNRCLAALAGSKPDAEREEEKIEAPKAAGAPAIDPTLGRN